MFTIPADLDAWADYLATTTGYDVSSDPGTIYSGGLYLALPEQVERFTLTGLRVTQPLWILTDQPGKEGRDRLLTMLPVVLAAVGEGITAQPGVLTVGRTEWRGYLLPVPLTLTPSEG